ncbi:hypothetical protein D3C76_842650 [compost metagenome]
MGLRYTGPARHGDAVPGAQPAFEARRLDLVHAHALIMFGFDFTGGERHDPGLVRLAVQTVGGQLGIIGVRGDDHHPLPAKVRMLECPQDRLAHQPAETPAQTQLTTRQHLSLATEIEVTQAVHTPLEGLPVRVIATQQLDHRIEEASQPRAFYLQGQHQRRVVDQHDTLVQAQMLPVQVHLGLRGVGRKRVLIVVVRRIEQVIGKPGFVDHPAHHRQHQRQPPRHQDAAEDQQHQCDQQTDAFVAPMALEQLLFAVHGLTHTV